MGLLCWVFLIHPQTIGASPVLARVVDISYPVGDLVLLAILARVVVAEGWRTPTVRLLLLSLLAFLLGDSIWAFVNQVGFATTGQTESLINETFMAAYALVGAAALHPSSRELDTAMPVDDERVSHTLFILLTAASLVAPAVLTGQAIHGHVTDGIAISVCSVQLTALVLARMGYLLSHVQKQSARLRDLALEDPLTGLPNRRALQSHLANSLQKARREQITLTVAMIDLDHFKAFNDQFGHLAGDHLLKSAASAWAAQVRGTDMLARVGGEEFVLVLPDATVNQAEGVVAKLRGVTPLGQTFSAGLAQWDGEALLEELVNAADTAMYAAKHAGRNRTERAANVRPESAGVAALAEQPSR